MRIRHLAAAAGLVVAVASYASAHGPDQTGHQIADLGPFVLEGGATIENLRMSYVTHGTLNTRKDNTILFMHGFGANHHLVDHLVGPSMPFDTDKYFIIATDAFGNTQVGFEHSTSATNSGMKMNFPAYNLRDAVNAEYKLVTEGLGIDHLLAVAGISLGAEKTLHFVVNHPDHMDGAIPIVGGALLSSEGFFTFTNFPKVIENCAGWRDGNYDENPGECAAAWAAIYRIPVP